MWTFARTCVHIAREIALSVLRIHFHAAYWTRRIEWVAHRISYCISIRLSTYKSRTYGHTHQYDQHKKKKCGGNFHDIPSREAHMHIHA